jgi:POT family proton-dependent oligopeptide transporter
MDLSQVFFYMGLGFMIIGNGFFKPNISSMVGQLYNPGDKRTDSAYTIFYMGINVGAGLGPFVCGLVGDTDDPADFKWAFFAAGIGMLLGVTIFRWLKDKYGLSWQIVPTRQFNELMRDPNSDSAGRVMAAMLQMKKLDMQKLQDAADGKTV